MSASKIKKSTSASKLKTVSTPACTYIDTVKDLVANSSKHRIDYMVGIIKQEIEFRAKSGSNYACCSADSVGHFTGNLKPSTEEKKEIIRYFIIEGFDIYITKMYDGDGRNYFEIRW